MPRPNPSQTQGAFVATVRAAACCPRCAAAAGVSDSMGRCFPCGRYRPVGCLLGLGGAARTPPASLVVGRERRLPPDDRHRRRTSGSRRGPWAEVARTCPRPGHSHIEQGDPANQHDRLNSLRSTEHRARAIPQTEMIGPIWIDESVGYPRRMSIVDRPNILRPAAFATRTILAVPLSGSIALMRPLNSTSPAAKASMTV